MYCVVIVIVRRRFYKLFRALLPALPHRLLGNVDLEGCSSFDRRIQRHFDRTAQFTKDEISGARRSARAARTSGQARRAEWLANGSARFISLFTIMENARF
jgi:hypothetical protein